MNFWEFCRENFNDQWVILWPERSLRSDDNEEYCFLVGKAKVEEDFIILKTIYDEELIVRQDVVDVMALHHDPSDLEIKLRRNQIKEVAPCLESEEIVLVNE